MSESVQDGMFATIARIARVAVGSARQEACILHEAAGGDAAKLETFIQRRLAGEPVDRIAGQRGFWTLDLLVTPDVLSPRPDTETIVEVARNLLLKQHEADTPLRFLDLGTGSGAILLSLLVEFPGATGLGIDVSATALAVAAKNAARNALSRRVALRQGSWDDSTFVDTIGERFDLVVSNPPYIPHADLTTLEPEVRLHDPLLALDGGVDGLQPYRCIFPILGSLLQPDGIAVFEIGYGQNETIPALAAQCGLHIMLLAPDLAGIPRALALKMGN